MQELVYKNHKYFKWFKTCLYNFLERYSELINEDKSKDSHLYRIDAGKLLELKQIGETLYHSNPENFTITEFYKFLLNSNSYLSEHLNMIIQIDKLT